MPFFLLILALLLLTYGGLIDYFRRAWEALPLFNNKKSKEPFTPISVIISLRNEEKNIPGLLESLSKQSYPKNLFEVILVDDHSEDTSWSLLNSYDYKLMRHQVISLAAVIQQNGEMKSYKKKALEIAIQHATGNLIVATDADCRFETDWLLTIAQYHESIGAKFIAAPVKIIPTKSFVGIFQLLDFISLQGITAAAVFKKKLSMCNGANLAYEKAAFEEVGGFAGIDTIASGDDMLLMHKIFLKYPDKVSYLKHPSAIVSTAAVTSWKEFFQQRIRWASKAMHYQDKRIFWVLLLVYLVNVCFGILLVMAFFNSTARFFFFLLLIGKWLLEQPFMASVSRFYGQSKSMVWFPLMQPVHILYTIIAGWLGQFGQFEWKGRRLRK
jgi:poly-beta-1,6-N-acetyl-D-glucosamine synthase